MPDAVISHSKKKRAPLKLNHRKESPHGHTPYSNVNCFCLHLCHGNISSSLSHLVSSGSDDKASAYNAGDLGLIPGLGRSSGEGNGNPLQCSCLENPMDRGAWQAPTVHGVAKTRTQSSDFTHLTPRMSSAGITSTGCCLVAQLVKKLPAMREIWVWSLGCEDPLEKRKATYSSILAWRIPWTEKSMALYKESDTTERLSCHFSSMRAT